MPDIDGKFMWASTEQRLDEILSILWTSHKFCGACGRAMVLKQEKISGKIHYDWTCPRYGGWLWFLLQEDHDHDSIGAIKYQNFDRRLGRKI